MIEIHYISWCQLQHYLWKVFWKVPNVITVTLIVFCGFKRKAWEQTFLFFFCCVTPWGKIFSINYLSQWKLCWRCTANPPVEQRWRTLLFKGWEDKFFLSCFILSLVVLFCCAFVTLVQEPWRNNTVLHFKSLLKHRRSYLCCDNVGLLFCVSWLLINRLFISIGFTTSLITSLLSLTKVFSSTLQEKYLWSKQMGTWLPLLSMCTVCCTLDGWLAVLPASSLPEILYCYISPSWLLRFYMFIK